MAARFDMLRFYLGRLGRPGVFGLLLLLASAVALSTVVRAREAALAELRLRSEQARQAAAAEQVRAAHMSDQALARPALAPEAAEALRRLYAAADESGLELVKGDYRVQESSDASMLRYQFQLPVYGSYAEVRKFLAFALNDDPALALVSVQLRRDTIDATDLDVVLSFTLYLESAP